MRQAKDHQTNHVVDHSYIDCLMHGLDRVIDIAMAPLTSLMKHCMIDSDKEKYIAKILNCYDRASILSKLSNFTIQIQQVTGKTPEIQGLSTKIMTTLIDINPLIADIIEKILRRELSSGRIKEPC